MPHLESKTKLIMTASVNRYINPIFYNKNTARCAYKNKKMLFNLC